MCFAAMNRWMDGKKRETIISQRLNQIEFYR